MIADCGLEEAGRGRARGPITLDEPNLEPIVRNEPNPTPPGAAGGGKQAKRTQTWEAWSIWEKAGVVWSVAWPGVKRAKRTQFAAGGPGLRIGDFGLKQAGPRQVPEGKCAKRTQFRPAGRQMRRTKPNLGGPGYLGKGVERAAVARAEGKCAEQTQLALRCREAKLLVER
jgi:hypothetical protein